MQNVALATIVQLGLIAGPAPIEVLLPLLARRLGGGSGLFATLTVVRGCGALVASMYRGRPPAEGAHSKHAE